MTIGIGILVLVVLILISAVIHLHRRLKLFLIGIKSENIDHSLKNISADLLELQNFRAELEVYLNGVEKRLRRSVQSVETVRFNPFQGVGAGGNQSFATSFLNEDGDGVIVSSLYSRDHSSVFSKAVKKRASEHELSNEESLVLESAIRALGR